MEDVRKDFSIEKKKKTIFVNHKYVDSIQNCI